MCKMTVKVLLIQIPSAAIDINRIVFNAQNEKIKQNKTKHKTKTKRTKRKTKIKKHTSCKQI